ncbi:Hypothetical protein SRAE_1000304000 [Strongyloides ratti]|uniref:Uncharacterized protein n=1 Tax=Strongyloides ratti TaxID=34506 RepID=A0A090L501_STRRB|nr:Hypothetical protein SRAE_1000304000 [Strongyloides ratti]CEF64787.1 Hypothetical protein SRAE_1000304000 [Strongyloides ratti]
MPSDHSIHNDDEIKLARYIKDSLKISENLSKNLKQCIKMNNIQKNTTKIRKSDSPMAYKKCLSENKSNISMKSRRSISDKRRLSRSSKNKRSGSKVLISRSRENRKAQIRRGLPTAFHGDLNIGTTYVDGKPHINMRCNPKNIFNSFNNCLSDGSFGNKNNIKLGNCLSKMSSSNTSQSEKSSIVKNINDKKNNLRERTSSQMSSKKVERNILKKTPHVFDPLNSEDTYPNIVRSPITTNSVTSVIPYCRKKTQNEELTKDEDSYKEIPGTHVGYLIKTFKKNNKTKMDESIIDIIFDLSINIDKNKKVIPLNIIANFVTDKNPVVATNGIIFEKE